MGFVPLPPEPYIKHERFIDTAAHIGGIIRKLEEILVIANREQWEFNTFSHSHQLFEALENLRYDLQAMIEYRIEKKFERLRDMQSDAPALNVSRSQTHSVGIERTSKSGRACYRLLNCTNATSLNREIYHLGDM